LEGDLAALPLPDADVDHVTCTLALSHVTDLRPFFAEAARVMRPVGHLITLDVRGYYVRSARGPAPRVRGAGVRGALRPAVHAAPGRGARAADARAAGHLGAGDLGPGRGDRRGRWPVAGDRLGLRAAARRLTQAPIRSPSTSTSSSVLRSGQKHTSPATPWASRSGVSYPHTASCSVRSPTRTDQ